MLLHTKLDKARATMNLRHRRLRLINGCMSARAEHFAMAIGATLDGSRLLRLLRPDCLPIPFLRSDDHE